MACIESQFKTFLKLSVMVPIFQSIGFFINDILVPVLQNILLKKNEKIVYKHFLLRLLIAVTWPALLCYLFGHSNAFVE